MFKKILIIFILVFSFINTSSGNAPGVNCLGLPGCESNSLEETSPANISDNIGLELVTRVIGQVIQLVAGIAVISLILSGILYLLSGGEEDKVKKAKSWIIWSLVGVITSVSAWGIISVLNNLSIN